MDLRWPRGRYNGKRIVGIAVKVRIDLRHWNWRPRHVRCVGGLHWLCIYTFWEWAYDNN
jgi:hypothetical protein